MDLPRLTDPDFVQNPYPTYARARALGGLLWWEDWGMYAAFDHATIHTAFRDKRLGRTPLKPREWGAHLAPFAAFEAHSMLELEPPSHTRLRGLVLRAFTSRSIAALAPDIQATAESLLADQSGTVDLIPAFCEALPVRIIARLLGVPEDMSPDLLRWSHDMVSMYQAGKTRETEERAAAATIEFTDFLKDYIKARRARPADDLISALIAAKEDGARLNTDELISTCILLLNAGHEATVHTLGNAIKCLLEHETPLTALAPEAVATTVEELLRFDPPLHVFTRYVYEDMVVAGQPLNRGDQLALVIGAATRDPLLCPNPDRFDPTRKPTPHVAFGGGLHFCVGAPLARLELQIALSVLFKTFPNLQFAKPPAYSNTYHFHKLNHLFVTLA